MQETGVQSLGQEESLEKEMVTYSSILAWEIPWTEEPEGLQFMGSQRIEHNLATKGFPDPERWYGEGGGRGVQDWEHMYTCDGFMLMYGKTNTVL